jgi:hypothetical protein
MAHVSTRPLLDVQQLWLEPAVENLARGREIIARSRRPSASRSTPTG